MIKTAKGYRYFTQQQIDVCTIRKKIEQTSKEILQKRNNVEASIFQLGYHYPNAKSSRYRGLIKHQMWANMRCLWVNFVRVLNYITESLKTTFFKKIDLKMTFKLFRSTCKIVLQENIFGKVYCSQKLKIMAF